MAAGAASRGRVPSACGQSQGQTTSVHAPAGEHKTKPNGGVSQWVVASTPFLYVCLTEPVLTNHRRVSDPFQNTGVLKQQREKRPASSICTIYAKYMRL
eukprot:COSAG06_NODE_1982_length_7921_cov_162.133086_6_plen_99_part_00